MDIDDLTKVASRKRLNTDAEKLREKVCRETTKIIKLKVAQDTAYWDLKEKLQQVEGNHERLQQNMVEVQMQHEAISGQYQDELRLRPETLNKMSSTREICDVLEEYSERLKDTLSRCKRDQAALCDAYQRSGRLVRDAQVQRARADHDRTQLVTRLEEKLALTSSHHSQLVQFFTSSKQQLESELGDARQKLSAALQHKDDLTALAADLRRQLDLKQHDLQAKEEAVTSLQRDIKQLLMEFNQQAGDMKNTLHKQERDLKEATEANEALKKALSNQEEFTKGICAQNSVLQDKISGLEDEQAAMVNKLKDMENKLELANSEIANLKNIIQILNDQKLELENVIKNKDELLSKSAEELKDLEGRLQAMESDKAQVLLELTQAKDEGKVKVARIEELEMLVQQLEKKISDAEDEMAKQRDTAAQQVQALNTSIQQKDQELEARSDTITRLTSDVNASNEAISRTEAALQRLQRDAEGEREAARDTERKLRKQVEMLEGNVRSKDDELSKQMTIILDIRAEKERLQSKIEGMQGTIDNIQKELTGRSAPPASRPPPDHDDNALMCPPTKISARPPSPRLSLAGSEFRAPRADPKQLDSMLFGGLFSDGSMDGDTLDPKEVNRRFDALSRGERVSPMPLGALKRRAGAGVHVAQGGLKYKPTTDDNMSLSQVKGDMKIKERTFFKNKRVDAKSKRPKASRHEINDE